MDDMPVWSKLGEAWRTLQEFIRSKTGPAPSLSAHGIDGYATTLIDGSVYELYKPGGEWNVEIIFFHGLQLAGSRNACVSTWMSRSEPEELWPRGWLGKLFPAARILSVAYDACVTRESQQGRLDLHNTAENLFQDLIVISRVGQKWRCPVVLVGHCLGGLLIKQLCVFVARSEFNLARDKEAADNFVESLGGVFLFATPQLGMNFRGNLENGSPLVEALEVLKTSTQRLNESFQHHRTERKWELHGVGESHESTASDFKRLFHAEMVPEASSRAYMDRFKFANANHFDICRPENERDSSFQFLVQCIRDLMEKEATKKGPSLMLPKHGVIGQEEARKQVLEVLQENSRVVIIGMGGIGKTTLAKWVFNAMCGSFEYVSFVENLKDELKRSSLETLVGRNLYKRGVKMTSGEAAWTILRQKRVLLVLDDVDSTEQMDMVPNLEHFAEGSRLLTTSRVGSEEIFDGFCRFDVQFLDDSASTQLFCAYAVNHHKVPLDLVKKVVKKCDNLPLTFTVIGSRLGRETSTDIWTEVLDRLSHAEGLDGTYDDRLWGRLRLSFDSLGPLEKEIFLDCACFWGDFQEELTCLKASWPRSWGAAQVPWKNLLDRSLIYERAFFWWSKEARTVGMHEQIRDMGRNIACPRLRSVDTPITRIFTRINATNVERGKALQLLRNQTQVINYHIQGLRLDGDDGVLEMEISLSTLSNLPNLRFLHLDNVCLVGASNTFPKNLSYLILKNCSRKRSSWLPRLIIKRWIIEEDDLKNLVELVYLFVMDWKGGQLPGGLGKLKYLRVLEVSSLQLESLPDSICELSSLIHLHLLTLRLKKLPGAFGALISLRGLRLLHCYVLSELPDSLGQLKMLRRLQIMECPKLETLPRSFVDLSALDRVVIACVAQDGTSEEVGIMNVKLKSLSSCLAQLGWVIEGSQFQWTLWENTYDILEWSRR